MYFYLHFDRVKVVMRISIFSTLSVVYFFIPLAPFTLQSTEYCKYFRLSKRGLNTWNLVLAKSFDYETVITASIILRASVSLVDVLR